MLSDFSQRTHGSDGQPTFSGLLEFCPWSRFNQRPRLEYDHMGLSDRIPRPFSWRAAMGESVSAQQRDLCHEDPFVFQVVADLLETSALSWSILFSYLRVKEDFEDDLNRLKTGKIILDRALEYLNDIIDFLMPVDRKSIFLAECSEDADRQQVDAIAARLLKDFEFLRRDAEHLTREKLESINILMSEMSIRESKKALADARRVRLVTYLAFVFIPLSFVSSVFGMNVIEFSDPGPGIWQFFAVAVPLTLASLLWPIWWEFEENIAWTLGLVYYHLWGNARTS